MRHSLLPAAILFLLAPQRILAASDLPSPVGVIETADYIQIDTDALQARINKKGYVSGVAAGSLLDKKTEPQPWWDRVPGLMALSPLCRQQRTPQEALAHAA
jgi:hypothetical protein